MKRDYIEEILLKKERSKRNEREHILSYRKAALDAVVMHCKELIDVHGLSTDSYLKQDNEIHRYIPIGIIACAESYFRAVLKELIDFGLPFSENAANFNKTKDLKFDFAVVQAIQGKKVTVGDFVSHLLPMKSFDDISGTLSVLTGCDFLKELKIYFYKGFYFYHPESEVEITSEEDLTPEQLKNVGQIYEDVKETFRLRNIFCHEAAEPEIIDIPKIYRCYENSVKFLEAANEFIWELIDPNRPTSNVEWGERAGHDFEKVDAELESLVQKISHMNGEINQDFLDIHEAWKVYREKKSDLVANEWNGGSGQGIAIMNDMRHTTELRLIEIKEDIEKERYMFLIADK